MTRMASGLKLPRPARRRNAVANLAAIAAAVIALAFWAAALATVSPASASGVITVQAGHSNGVRALAFAAQGEILVSGSDDNTVRLWHVPSGRLLRSIAAPELLLDSGIAISQDGRRIAWLRYAGEKENIEVIDSASGQALQRITAPARTLGSSAFTADGERLVTVAPTDGTVSIRDVASGALRSSFPVPLGPGDGAGAVAFSRHAARVAIADRDRTVRLVDTNSGKILRTIRETATLIEPHHGAVQLSADAALLVTVAGHPATAKIWDTGSGRLLATVASRVATTPFAALAPDGRHFLTAEIGKTLRIWTRDGHLVRSIENAESRAAFTPDGRRLLVEREDFGLDLIDIASGQRQREFRRHGHAVRSIDVSRDGSLIAVGDSGARVQIWDALSGGLLRHYAVTRLPKEKTLRLQAHARFLGDGRLTIATNGLSTIEVRETASGRLLRSLAADCAALAAVPGGALAGCRDGTLREIDPVAGRTLRTLKGPGSPVAALAVNADGRTAAAGNHDGLVRLWDLKAGKPVRSARHSAILGYSSLGVGAVALSPDGRRLVSGGDIDADLATGKTGPAVKLRDATSGRLVTEIDGLGEFVGAAAFAPDGRSFVAGGTTGRLGIYDAQTGRALQPPSVHGGAINAAAYAPAGATIASGGDDGTMKLWRTETGELLATMIATPDGEWLVLTPEGFFSASAKGAELLHIVRGLEVTGIEQVYDALYRPDLVREKLAGDPKGLVKEAAARLDLDKVIASGAAPRATIISPREGVHAEGGRVTIEAEVTPQGSGGIGRIEWRVNGVTLGLGARGLGRIDGPGTPPSAPGGAARKITQALDLSAGENVIELVAYNAANLIASAPARITVTYAAPAAAATDAPPRLFVLAAGINDYFDSRLRLNHAVPDARALGAALAKAGAGLYAAVSVTTLADAEVTAKGLDAAFAKLAGEVRPGDVFVFFLAGHGKTVDGRYVFLPQDFRYRGEEHLAADGIGQAQWQAWLARIPARKSVLIYDTCESGSLTGDEPATRGLERLAGLDRLTRATGRTTLTAATEVAPALEGFRGHGVFTYALLDAFGAADANGDGMVDVTELAAHIDREVPELSHKAFRLRQVPQMRIQGQNFPLAKATAVLAAPAREAASSAPPPATGPVGASPTHVVLRATDVFAAPGGRGPVVQRLAPGTLVTLVRRDGEWIVIARGGTPLGTVAASALAPVQ